MISVEPKDIGRLVKVIVGPDDDHDDQWTCIIEDRPEWMDYLYNAKGYAFADCNTGRSPIWGISPGVLGIVVEPSFNARTRINVHWAKILLPNSSTGAWDDNFERFIFAPAGLYWIHESSLEFVEIP